MMSDFVSGVRRALPVVLSALPFGLLFGALAVDNGLSTGQAVLMSATVFAGASQMVGLELFGTDASALLIAASIFVVNLRHLLYSATLGRRMAGFTTGQKAVSFFLLTDPQFAEAEREAEATGGFSFAWYLGVGVAFYAMWQAGTLTGALFGRLIPDPERWGIDFLLTIYFLGLVMGFRKRAFWLPVVLVSAVASVIAFKLIGSPWHISVGALAGVLFAAAFGVRGEGRTDG
jgi:predicted branched-subunit amino acid permease